MEIRSETLIAKPVECPLGRLSVAGTIRNSKGFPGMRVLGSYAVVYLLRGGGHYTDARGVALQVQAGDLLMLYPEIAHTYGRRGDQEWDEIFIVFDGVIFDLWRRQGLLEDSKPVSRLEPVEYWLRRFESVARPAGDPSPLEHICRLQQVLAEVRAYQQSRRMDQTDLAWLTRATELLEADVLLEDFQLQRVAESMGCSYVGFRKKFARLSGTSPAKFHMKAVIDRACEIIRREGLNNRQVAYRLGFCDEFHFSRRFKQIVGLSPREFRQQIPREK